MGRKLMFTLFTLIRNLQKCSRKYTNPKDPMATFFQMFQKVATKLPNIYSILAACIFDLLTPREITSLKGILWEKVSFFTIKLVSPLVVPTWRTPKSVHYLEDHPS